MPADKNLSSHALLDVRDLCISFVDGNTGGAAPSQPETSARTKAPSQLEAVNKLNLQIAPAEIVGVVGESGCGKSVFAQSILRLLEHEQPMVYSGQILYQPAQADSRSKTASSSRIVNPAQAESPVDLLALPLKAMRTYRGAHIGMVFQDPLSSLNPVMTIGAQLVEAIRAHQKISKVEARKQAVALLGRVGIKQPEARMRAYPGDFSGGMRQRVMIAMALAQHPRLLIADEPTTALDTTTQKQILDLLRELNQTEGMAVLLISHDLGVVASVCSRVHVMYLGQIVEELSAAQLLEAPGHPYTRALIASVPPLEGSRQRTLSTIEGQVPPLTNIPAGCRFAPRCPHATGRCRNQEPPASQLAPGHTVKCWLYTTQSDHQTAQPASTSGSLSTPQPTSTPQEVRHD